MSHGFRETLGRALFLLTVFGLFAVAAPGCGEEPKKEAAAGASNIPANVQESNNNMLKTQKMPPSK